MIPDVFALLNTSAVRAYVGTTPPRIYRHGTAPELVAAPYVTWFVVSGTPENHLDGTPPVDNVSIQVDAWSNNTGSGAIEIERLGVALRDAIEASHHITQFGNNGQDAESSRYRISITFSFWNPR
jgi:hypothetical protein